MLLENTLFKYFKNPTVHMTCKKRSIRKLFPNISFDKLGKIKIQFLWKFTSPIEPFL
jgi:hypothetical protein